ncbi:MAG TPA: NAD(P)H-hydrate epimerase, partial [Phycisphaerae bacterium]|nr:NAD(P)H-hydrate epimerase [Phycisphaerae bacterium]
LSRRQVREADRRAIDEWGVPGVVLMENAGRGAADVIQKFLAELNARTVVVVAGRGNNGGDGFVIARHLRLRGVPCTVLLVSDWKSLRGDAALNYEILSHVGVQVMQVAEDGVRHLAPNLREFDLIVDAVGGTGIVGPLRGHQATVVEQINAAGRPVVAVDIPTGLDCDTGEAPGAAVKADLTVTFHARKIGFDEPGAAEYTGRVVVADIGIPLS